MEAQPDVWHSLSVWDNTAFPAARVSLEEFRRLTLLSEAEADQHHAHVTSGVRIERIRSSVACTDCAVVATSSGGGANVLSAGGAGVERDVVTLGGPMQQRRDSTQLVPPKGQDRGVAPSKGGAASDGANRRATRDGTSGGSCSPNRWRDGGGADGGVPVHAVDTRLRQAVRTARLQGAAAGALGGLAFGATVAALAVYFSLS